MGRDGARQDLLELPDWSPRIAELKKASEKDVDKCPALAVDVGSWRRSPDRTGVCVNHRESRTVFTVAAGGGRTRSQNR